MKCPSNQPASFRARALLPLLLGSALGLAACGGDSAFPTFDPSTGPGGTGGGRDQVPPTVEFQVPASGFTVAVGDSVFTQVRVQDDRALASLQISGFAVRGDPNLGTDQEVIRFAPKTVTFDPQVRVVRDTVITRYLVATADTLREGQVFLVAVARDTAGNTSADTLQVAIGGPRVQINAPTSGQEFRAGTSITVRIEASDRIDRLRAVRLRASGAITLDTTLVLSGLAEQVDTAIVLNLPANAVGDLRLEAGATSARNVDAVSRPITVRVTPPTADQTPPRVTFTSSVRTRSEVSDTFSVTVSATDETRVDTVGVSVAAIRRQAGRTDTLLVVTRRVAGSQMVQGFTLRDFNLPPLLADTVSVSFEITAFAKDAAGNCAAATVPDTPLSEPCRTGPGGAVVSDRPGSRTDVVLVRGRTIRLFSASRIADLASDGSRVFLSNLPQNVVEVFSVSDSVITQRLSVGSEPWGLAVGRGNDTLFVANSGGTTISVVPLVSGTLQETSRIRTSDIRLYDVTYDAGTGLVGSVVMRDYSDRPQFIGQTSAGQLLYSTKPTPTRADGTVRIVDPARDTTYAFNRGSEIFVGYAERREGRALVVNALDAGRTPLDLLAVCPRRLLPSQPDPSCISGTVAQVSAGVAALRTQGLTDTRVDISLDGASVGLSDTTFVAISGDHSTVAFGEGVVQFGRIMLFGVRGNTLQGTSLHTQDLIGNAAERVIGLALNADGSLGVARGSLVYFFSNNIRGQTVDPSLRLQGIVPSGSPSGGVAVHPANRDYPDPTSGSRLGFASGLDERQVPYVDVLDTYSFRVMRRFHLRDPIVGAMIAVPVAAGDPEAGRLAVRIFAVTSGGVVQLGLTPADLPSTP